MRFKTYEYADVSTAYLEDSDLELLSSAAPCHIFEHDGGLGSIFFVPGVQGQGFDKFSSYVELWKQHGLSKRFIKIMHELHKQGIPYVRFDADGEAVEGMKPAKGR